MSKGKEPIELDSVDVNVDTGQTTTAPNLKRGQSVREKLNAVNGTIGRGLQTTIVSFLGIDEADMIEENVTVTPEEVSARKFGNLWRFKAQKAAMNRNTSSAQALRQLHIAKEWSSKPLFFRQKTQVRVSPSSLAKIKISDTGEGDQSDHDEDDDDDEKEKERTVSLTASDSQMEEFRERSKSDGLALAAFHSSEVQGKRNGRGRKRPSLNSVYDKVRNRRAKSLGAASAEIDIDIDTLDPETIAILDVRDHRAYFTVTTVIVQICVMAFMLISSGFATFPDGNPFFGPSQAVLVQYGAKYYPSPHDADYYRIFTSLFVHNGLIFLVFIVILELTIGRVLEERFGPRVIPIFILSGMGGNLMSSVLIPQNLVCGASGAVYGYFGVLLIDLIQNWKNLEKPMRSLGYLLLGIVVSLVAGLFPMLDNFSHLGGFIFGVLSAMVFLPHVAFTKSILFKIILVVIVIPVLLFSLWFLWFVFKLGFNVGGWCPWCLVINCLPIANWCSY